MEPILEWLEFPGLAARGSCRRHRFRVQVLLHRYIMKPPPLLAALLLLLTFSPGAQAGAPLTLHPENPHYFPWRGQPVVIVSSGEHYGAVVNRAFDYHRYLETLAADGLNYTGILTGA